MRSVVALLVARASSRPLDLDPAIRRFLVLTQPRSGSTWFCKYSANLAAFSGVVTAGVVTTVTSAQSLAKLKYIEQGDLDMYEQEAEANTGYLSKRIMDRQ